MKNLRVVFMGTPDFAKGILEYLYDNGVTIVGVVTVADKPAGRGQKISESAVKKYASEKNLPLLQPLNLKDEQFIADLKALEVDLAIVVAFRMLPEVVWKMPKYGTFNLHASLLPQYRGAAPINWALINGETKTGVTTFFIDDKIDTGEIILAEEIDIEPTDTVSLLHDKLMQLGTKIVLQTVQQISEGKVVTQKQPNTDDLKTAHKLNKDNCKIDWNKDAKTIYNQIRGLNAYPGAWCSYKNGAEEQSLKIFNCTYALEQHQHQNGTVVVASKSLKVATFDGFLEIESLQLSGKRVMRAKELLNGFRFPEGCFFY